MHIEHLAIWTNQLEELKEFYVMHFGAIPNEKYSNHQKKFSSYFLEFDSGSRLEIMQMEGIKKNPLEPNQHTGLVHFAIGVDSRNEVDAVTEKLHAAGVIIYSQPRTTGDGYYESVIEDPDGNLIEIASKATNDQIG